MDDTKMLSELGEALYKKDNFDKIEHDYMKGFNPTSELFKFYFNLDIARSLSVYDFFKKKNKKNNKKNKVILKILVIDDNIDTFKKIFNKLKETFCCLYFYKINGKFDSVIEKICEGTVETNQIECISIDNTERIDFSRLDPDVILLDIYLGKCKYSGQDVLNRLKWDFPGLPVFMLTKSHDIENIKECFQLKTEFFITKNRLSGLPYFIYKFYKENFGTVIFEFQDEDRKFLVRKITEWKRSRTLLWHGEKAQNIVEHTFEHSNMIWKLFNRFYEYGIFNNREKYLLPLALSIWLHDIGHKGCRKHIEPLEARSKHPLISGELIYRYPELYLGEEKAKDKDLIKNICLLSAYHMRASPLNKVSVENTGGLSKIKDDFKYPSSFEFLNKYWENKEEEIMYLEDIDENLVFFAACLRILDAIDKGVHRVGMGSEEDSKITTTVEDTIYYIKELGKEIKNLEEKIGSLRYREEYGDFLEKMKDFTEEIKDWVESEYGPDISKLAKKLKNPKIFSKDEEKKDEEKAESIYLGLYKVIKEFKDFNESFVTFKMSTLFSHEAVRRIRQLIDQIFFLIDTPLHFYTHRSVKNPDIEKTSDGYKIIYYFNEDFVNLPNRADFTFGDFNRLVQEGWKIWSDIYREYLPVRNILKSNGKELKEVEFRYKQNNEDVTILTFPLSDNFVEVELKLKFDDKKELEQFIEKMKENNIITESEKETVTITDSFYDTPVKDLIKRKWSLRERRTINSPPTTKWEIKIEPLYWKGDYEYRIELGPCDNIRREAIFQKILDGSKYFSMDRKIGFPPIDYNKPFASYTQTRSILQSVDKEIEISKDYIGILVDSTVKELYLLEFEIKGNSPNEKEGKMEKLKNKLKKFYPELEDLIYTKTKLDWAEEQIK